MQNSKSYPSTVKEKTGKSWDEWFTLLDKGKCGSMNHKQIVAWIMQHNPVSPWWCQMVTVGYEKHKGLRQENEMIDGFQISVSKTLPKPSANLYELFFNPSKRKRWLDEPLTIRTTVENKKIRMVHQNGSAIEVVFTAKGTDKCTVGIQQSKLKNKALAERMKKFWKEKLELLGN